MRYVRGLLAGAAVMVALPASAATLYTTGFEMPAFTPGAIAGQSGWQTFSADGEQAKAVIESGFAYSGNQAVKVSGINQQTGPYYSYGPIVPTVPITISAELYLAGGDFQFAALGPDLAQFAGGVNLANDGSVYSITANGGKIGSYSLNVWHSVALTLDYGAQRYAISLDGQQLAAAVPFCGGNSGCSGAAVTMFGSVVFDAFDTQQAGYLDDLVISEAPEPAAWATMILGIATIGGAMRRRRFGTRAAGRAAL